MMDLTCLPNQRDNEHVVKFLRRNWTTPASIIAAFVLLLGVPGIILFLFWQPILTWLSHPIIGPVLTTVASMYVLGVWLVAFLEFTDYYLDTWIITNERVLNIEQNGLFNRVASELHLASVQDVTSDVKGMVRTFLDFGDVFIQTAAEKERFALEGIDHPERIKELVINLVEEDKRRHAGHLMAQIAKGEKTLEETA